MKCVWSGECLQWPLPPFSSEEYKEGKRITSTSTEVSVFSTYSHFPHQRCRFDRFMKSPTTPTLIICFSFLLCFIESQPGQDVLKQRISLRKAILLGICGSDGFVPGSTIFSALSALMWQMQISPILRTMDSMERRGRWRNTYLICRVLLCNIQEMWNE